MTGDLHGLTPHLVTKLLKMEEQLNGELELRITSGFRAGDPLAHGKGMAADLAIAGGYARRQMVTAALRAGFPRIGVYESHIHVDVDTRLPHPVLWVNS